MPDQLSFSTVGTPPPPPPPDVPPVVAEILHIARSMVFSARIVRGCWGIGIGSKRKWVLTGDCCCALGAVLVTKEAVADPHETSPRATVMRILGLTGAQLDSFMHGFDDHWYVEDESEWYRYGEMVAKRLEVVP
jgi:hypothetical protein